MPSRLNSGNLPDSESSFSYLPSIPGVARTKLLSGASADFVVSGRRQRYTGAQSKTGKNPLLMNSMRRLGNGLVLDTEKGNGIKLFDAAKAREMLARRSSQESVNNMMTPDDKRTNRNIFAKKGMNIMKDASVISSVHKPSINSLLSPNSQAKRHAFR